MVVLRVLDQLDVTQVKYLDPLIAKAHRSNSDVTLSLVHLHP